MIGLEIISMLSAIAALVMAFVASRSEHSEAVNELTTYNDAGQQAKLARASGDALHEKGELLAVKGKQEEAQLAFKQRSEQYRRAEELEASKEQPPLARKEEQVTLSRRAVTKALWAAGLGTASAVTGAWSGIAGTGEDEASPGPSPSTSR
jgi:hypothetical protein